MAATQGRPLSRASEIVQVAVRHGFGYIFEGGRVRELVPWPGRVSAEPPAGTRGQRLRAMLDELGPTFVKLGQMLSLRPDVVPPDIVEELQTLQDRAAPVAFEDVRRVLEAELGGPLEQHFTDFEREPIASASIGQVHRATLPDGTRVAVKVQRPDAEKQIENDLALLLQLARLASEQVRRLDFVDTVAVVDELGRSLRAELDYRREARSAAVFAGAFAEDENVVIPGVHWSHSTRRVLTLDLLEGTHLRDVGEEMPLAQRRIAAERVVSIWLQMIFLHGHFHGDPHPANILVLEDGRIGLLDFGSTGRLSDGDRRRLVRLFVDAVAGRTDALPQRLSELGVRFPRSAEPELRADLDALWHRYAGATLGEVDATELLREIGGVVNRHALHLPARFALLDRTLLVLASVGQALYPPLDVLELARPYAEELVRSQLSPGALIGQAREDIGSSAQALLDLPREVTGLLEEARRGEVEVGVRLVALQEPMRMLDATVNRFALALLVASMLIASALLANVAVRAARARRPLHGVPRLRGRQRAGGVAGPRRRPPRSPLMGGRRLPRAVGVGAALLGASTAVVFALEGIVPVENGGIVYLPAVIVMAWRFGLRAGVVAGLLAMFLYNILFLPPRHTITIDDSRNWQLFAVTLICVTIVAQLAARERQRAAEALEREREAALLAGLASALVGGATLEAAQREAASLAAAAVGAAGGRIARGDGPAPEGVIALPLRVEGRTIGRLELEGAPGGCAARSRRAARGELARGRARARQRARGAGGGADRGRGAAPLRLAQDGAPARGLARAAQPADGDQDRRLGPARIARRGRPRDRAAAAQRRQ